MHMPDLVGLAYPTWDRSSNRPKSLTDPAAVAYDAWKENVAKSVRDIFRSMLLFLEWNNMHGVRLRVLLAVDSKDRLWLIRTGELEVLMIDPPYQVDSGELGEDFMSGCELMDNKCVRVEFM